MEGDLSCYRGGHFNGGRMVMLLEVASLKGESSLQRWPVSRRVKCRYRGGHFNKTHVT